MTLYRYDATGRRTTYRRAPHGRLLLPALVLVVIGTSAAGVTVAAKAAAALLLLAAVVVWAVRPLLERGDR